jgi:hypothetical protein
MVHLPLPQRIHVAHQAHCLAKVGLVTHVELWIQDKEGWCVLLDTLQLVSRQGYQELQQQWWLHPRMGAGAQPVKGCADNCS